MSFRTPAFKPDYIWVDYFYTADSNAQSSSNISLESIFATYKSSKIHYLKFGKGKKILFAFHGFSESGQSFLALEPALKDLYTVIAIDIPYHGKTEWREPTFFTTSDLVHIMQQLTDALEINRFSVLGFSMGGKCALFITKHFAERVDELILMASDGIRTNKIYNVAVYPRWGRELFKTTIRHPRWLMTTVRIARSLHIISPWLYKFTFNHMDTKEKRQRLYDTWISMAHFNPDIELVKKKIRENNIHTILFFGKRDEVIPVSVGEFFAEGIENCNLIRLDRGHYFIDERLVPFLREALQPLQA